MAKKRTRAELEALLKRQDDDLVSGRLEAQELRSIIRARDEQASEARGEIATLKGSADYITETRDGLEQKLQIVEARLDELRRVVSRGKPPE